MALPPLQFVAAISPASRRRVPKAFSFFRIESVRSTERSGGDHRPLFAARAADHVPA